MTLSNYQPFDLGKINEIKYYKYKKYIIKLSRNAIDGVDAIILLDDKIVDTILNIRKFSNSAINKYIKTCIKNNEKQMHSKEK